MAGKPINPDREQQEADNRASRRQSTIGPLPAELEDKQEQKDGDGDRDRQTSSEEGSGSTEP